MWYEELEKDQSWSSLWYGYIRCTCGGIHKFKENCPVCGEPIPSLESTVFHDSNGQQFKVLPAYMGAEGRYEDYIYLQMLEREWMRPVTDEDLFLSISETSPPSAKAIVVLIFWTYFETRIERIFREVTKSLPKGVLEDLLHRYSSIGYRLEKLYKILFSKTYWADLQDLGYTEVANLLQQVHKRRNEFSHGHPEAIDDLLVKDLIGGLKDEHESWIAVFNKRLSQANNSSS